MQMKKAIVITGGSSGIGKAMVEAFLNNGEYYIISLSRRKLKTDNPRIIQLPTDITKYDEVKLAFDTIAYKKFEIIALINNAGIFKQKPLRSFLIDEMDVMIDTNLRGSIYCTYEAIKTMKEGNIINICSVAGKYGIKNQSVYCATKYGMRGFAESLSQELKNIFITTVYLGGTDTPLRRGISENKEELIKPEQVAKIIFQIMTEKRNMVMKEVTIFSSNEVKEWN